MDMAPPQTGEPLTPEATQKADSKENWGREPQKMTGQCNRGSGKAVLAFSYGMPARNNQFEMAGAKEYMRKWEWMKQEGLFDKRMLTCYREELWSTEELVLRGLLLVKQEPLIGKYMTLSERN